MNGAKNLWKGNEGIRAKKREFQHVKFPEVQGYQNDPAGINYV